MDKSSREVADALKELSKRPVQYFAPRDNREMGAIWPAPQPDDLPQDYWTDRELEII